MHSSRLVLSILGDVVSKKFKTDLNLQEFLCLRLRISAEE
jgi:hypothetical protein